MDEMRKRGRHLVQYFCRWVSRIKKDMLSKQSLYTDQFTSQVNVLNVHQILFLDQTSPLCSLSAYLALCMLPKA